jgi:hypothetical protein
MKKRSRQLESSCFFLRKYFQFPATFSATTNPPEAYVRKRAGNCNNTPNIECNGFEKNSVSGIRDICYGRVAKVQK